MGRYGEFKGFVIDRLMGRIGQNNRDLVFTGGQSHQNHRLSAGIRPVPRCVIHHHVNVSDARGHPERIRTEHRLDTQIFDAILNKDRPFAQRTGERWIDNQPGGGCGCSSGATAAGPLTSAALRLSRARPGRWPTPGQVSAAVKIDDSSLSPYPLRVITETEDHFYVSAIFAGGGVLYPFVSVSRWIQCVTFCLRERRTIVIARAAITSVNPVETHIAPAIPSVLLSHA